MRWTYALAQQDLLRLLDVARARRDEWVLRRVHALKVCDHGLMQDADQIIADREDIIADLEREAGGRSAGTGDG